MAIVEECMLARISLIFTLSPYRYAGPVPKRQDLVLSLFPAISLFQPGCGRPWSVLINQRCGRVMLRQSACVLGLTKPSRHRRRGRAGGKDEALCPKSNRALQHDYCLTAPPGGHGKLRSTDNTNRYPWLPAYRPPWLEVLRRLVK